EMPIQFSSVLEEHRACREHAVAFDVSHLGSVRVAGAGAYGLLQWAFTNDLARIEPGRAQYTHLLDPDDAHVVDDIIVWWVGDDEFLVMPNASNTAPLLAALDDASRRHADGACTIADVTTSRAVIAVQGPAARKELGALQAGLSWVVRFDKGDFRGRAPLLAERERGIHRRLRGLVLEGRQIPRTGYAVQMGEEPVGEVTSGNFSPVLERGIALAFLRPDVDEGASVSVDIRGRPAPAVVTRPPFVRHGN